MPEEDGGYWLASQQWLADSGDDTYAYHRLLWFNFRNATGDPQTVIIGVAPDIEVHVKLADGESVGSEFPDIRLPDGFALTLNGCTGSMVVAEPAS